MRFYIYPELPGFKSAEEKIPRFLPWSSISSYELVPRRDTMVQGTYIGPSLALYASPAEDKAKFRLKTFCPTWYIGAGLRNRRLYDREKKKHQPYPYLACFFPTDDSFVPEENFVGRKAGRMMWGIIYDSFYFGYPRIPKSLIGSNVRTYARINSPVKPFDRIGLAVMPRIRPMLYLISTEEILEVFAKKSRRVVAYKKLWISKSTEPLLFENLDYQRSGYLFNRYQNCPLGKKVE